MLAIPMENKGKRWQDEEVMRLLTSVRKKVSHKVIAEEHKRTLGAIVSQLKKLACEYHEGDGYSLSQIQTITGLTREEVEEAIQRKAAKEKVTYYAIVNTVTGESEICTSWAAAEEKVTGVKGMIQKSFATKGEAEVWLTVKKKEYVVEMKDEVKVFTPAPVEEISANTYSIDSLSPEQREAYISIRNGENIFLTGPGGTGKSYLIGLLKQTIPDIAITAMTGCAALLLGHGARTIHSWAGIGLGTEPVDRIISRLRFIKTMSSGWRKSSALVIDEVSMMTPEILELLDEVGQRIRNSPLPFGGLQLIFVGDFLQLPPVTKGEESRFAFQSPTWHRCIKKTIQLKRIFRQKDAIFQKILDEARIGALSPESLEILKSRRGLDYSQELIQPTILSSRKTEVEMINARSLATLEGEAHTYTITTKGNGNPSSKVKTIVERMDRDGSYVTELILKLGAQVMLLKNLSQEEGLVNGSRGVVVGFSLSGKPIVRFRNGTTKTIKEESWKSDTEAPVERIQIPLRLAYAITIHKSQGSTLDCALIDVGPNIFEYGQAYVALSRAKSLDSLYIKAVTSSAFRANPVVLAFYEGRPYPIGSTAPPPLQDDTYNIEDDIPDVSITEEECKVVLTKKGSDIRSFFQPHR